MDCKPFGFLQEDFHSEVLSFIFEMISLKEPTRKMILYNNIDKYNNKGIYTSKFPNLQVRELDNFFPDLESKTCEKIFIVSYDNILHFSFFLPYKKDLIFIAHSPKHIKHFRDNNVDFFSLTGFLSSSYMTPFIKTPLLTNEDIINREESSNVKRNQEYIEQILKTKSEQDMQVVMTLGSFLGNNRDIKLIHTLLDTNKFILIIFSCEFTKELQDIVELYKNKVFVALNLHTKEILHTINHLGISHLLFVPPSTSDFFTSSWSGSIQFAFDNNIKLVMPKALVDYYNIDNDGIVAYKMVDDIISGLSNTKHLDCTDHYQIVRNRVFDRNNVIYDILLNRIQTSKLGHYKINYIDDVDKGIKTYQEIFKHCKKFSEYLNDKLVVDIDPENCILSLTCLLSSKCKVVNFLSDLECAKYFKSVFLYNDLDKRISFFNNVLTDICKANCQYKDLILDSFTLDSFNYENVGLISVNSDLVEYFITGAKTTITKCKPTIVIKHKTTQNDWLTDLGYTLELVNGNSVYEIKE
jgi:hypothetical protein